MARESSPSPAPTASSVNRSAVATGMAATVCSAADQFVRNHRRSPCRLRAVETRTESGRSGMRGLMPARAITQATNAVPNAGFGRVPT